MFVNTQISITDIQAINIPLNIFQRDVFSVNFGNEIEIKSPIDGSEIKECIPKFGAIVSNLPFVEYNKIAVDEQDFITQIRTNKRFSFVTSAHKALYKITQGVM